VEESFVKRSSAWDLSPSWESNRPKVLKKEKKDEESMKRRSLEQFHTIVEFCEFSMFEDFHR